MKRFVLFEDEASRWAVPEEAVASVEALGRRVLVRLRSGDGLLGERVVGRKKGGERPLGPVLSHFLPRGVTALALVGGMPVPVVDPGHPPERLLAGEEGEQGQREKGGVR